jgi:streptomycin 6-kinase
MRPETDLKRYPKSWKLTALCPTSRRDNTLLTPVNTAFGPAMLKQAIDGKNLRTSSSLLRWYQGSGSANILKKRKNVQLLEWIDGPALSELVNNQHDNQAIDALGNVIKKLHAPKAFELKTKLTPLQSVMRPLLAQRYADNLIHRHAARLIRCLLQTTQKQTQLHGDLHFDKILHHSKRGWLTIAPQGISGDPHYEPAAALCHPDGQPDFRHVRARIEARASRIAKKLALNKDRLLTYAFCHACLKTLETEQNGENASHWRDMSVILLDSLVD